MGAKGGVPCRAPPPPHGGGLADRPCQDSTGSLCLMRKDSFAALTSPWPHLGHKVLRLAGLIVANMVSCVNARKCSPTLPSADLSLQRHETRRSGAASMRSSG